MSERVMHAQNPRWSGPLCRYPTPDASSSCADVSKQTDGSDVTCSKCRQKLGLEPTTYRMPGQKEYVKKRKLKWPLKLSLKEAARWQGYMMVYPCSSDGKYPVHFNAVDKRSVSEPFVYDRTLLTRTQIQEWTGVDLGGEKWAKSAT